MIIGKVVRTAVILLVAGLALGAGAYYMAETAKETSEKGTYNPVSRSTGEPTTALKNDETLAFKNETVYVLLDHDGTVSEQRIVNRIYDRQDPEASTIVDYGKYSSVISMISNGEPLRENDRVLWDSHLLEEKDIYYEGLIDKEMPVEIKINYYLDGEAVSAPELAGKSGKLEIEIKCKNNLSYKGPISYYDYHGNLVTVNDENYVPLLIQGTVEADLNRFSDIDPGESTKTVTGQSAGINFMVFPYPEEALTISMTGEDIELERITFVVLPQLPPLPELDMEDDLQKMLKGTSMISRGLKDLHDGTDQLLQGMVRFQSESRSLTGQADEMAALIKKYNEQREKYSFIIEDINLEEFSESLKWLRAVLAGTNELPDIPDPGAVSADLETAGKQAEELSRQLELLTLHLSGLENTSPEIKEAAGVLIAENEPGSSAHELGVLLLSREEQLAEALSRSRQIDLNLEELNSLVAALSSQWSGNYLPGLSALKELSDYMEREPQEVLDLLLALPDELARYESYYNQVDDFILQADKMLGELSGLPGALDKMVYGQTEIRDGLQEMRQSGILAIEEGLIEAVNESRFAAAKMDLMEELADDYRSHADNDQNRHSEVQFIMQTPKLHYVRPEAEPDYREKEEQVPDYWVYELWSKVVNLFK